MECTDNMARIYLSHISKRIRSILTKIEVSNNKRCNLYNIFCQGSIALVRYYIGLHIPRNENYLLLVTGNVNYISSVKYLSETDFRSYKYGANIVMFVGPMECLKYCFHEIKDAGFEFRPMSGIIDIALHHGSIECIDCFYRKGYRSQNNMKDVFKVTDNVTDSQLLVCMRYLHERGSYLSLYICGGLIDNNRLECLKYYLAKGGKLCKGACTRAIEAGDLRILKYLVSRGSKLDKKSRSAAIVKGNKDILEYLETTK